MSIITIRKVKVLWFSNTPAAGAEILKGYGIRGNWLASLDRALRDRVDLSVGFVFARFAEPFKHHGVLYLPICKKNWRLNIIKQNLLGDSFDGEDLQIYLEIINNIKPDIIHIHGSENPFGCIIEEVDVPVVLSIQGNYTVYTHKYFSGVEEKYSSLKDGSPFSPRFWIFNKSYKQMFKSSFIPNAKREQKYLGKSRYIIGRTDWDRRITRILSPQSKYYHNDEVLRDLFYLTKWGKPDNEKIIVHSTIGDSIFKGFETICQSLHELIKIGLDIEWRVAGISEDCLLVKIVKRKLKETYPDKGLILLGDLNEKELVEKMLEADIYVMPSHIENSPNSLCEAMILGMPCITTLAGGSSSLLRDKEEGLVIQDGDPWSMAGAIIELYQNPEIAITYGLNARKTALDRHNPRKIANELLNIYSLIIQKHS